MLSEQAKHTDWGKQASKNSNQYWGGRWKDGKGDNLDLKKLHWYRVEKYTGKTIRKRGKTTKKYHYNYPAWYRKKKWKSYQKRGK